MNEEIEGFFQRYARAVAAMHIEELASLHHAPCLKVHGDGSVELLPDRDAVCAFFRELGGKYAARGYSGGRFHDLDVKPIGTAGALASLTWEQYGSDGGVYRTFRRSYNLIRSGTDWKILVATFHRA